MIEVRRGEFAVAVLGASTPRLEALVESLEGEGFSVHRYLQASALEEDLGVRPAHAVLFDFVEMEPHILTWSESLKRRAPEMRKIALVPLDKRLAGIHSKQLGIISHYILTPWLADDEVFSLLDQVFRDFSFQFENEQLKELLAEQESSDATKPTELSGAAALPGLDFLEPTPEAPNEAEILREFCEELLLCQTTEHVMDRFVAYAAGESGLIFRVWEQRGDIIPTSSRGIPVPQVRELKLHVPTEEWRDGGPERALRLLLTEKLNWSHPYVRTLDLEGRIVALYASPTGPVLDSLWSVFAATVRWLERFEELRKKTLRDAETDFWSSDQFRDLLHAEISRSRRLGMPTSLVLLELDQPAKPMAPIARLLRRTSRVNDVLVRLRGSQLAVILPHTPISGALIKAERFRRIVEAVGNGQTIRAGVSEYPLCASDEESLLTSADAALESLRGWGGNRVCRANAAVDLDSPMVAP